MAEEPDEVDVSSDVRKDKRAGGGGGGIAVRNYRGSDEKDHVGSASSSGAGPKLRSRKVGTPRRYMDGDEDVGSASASGATEAMSEQFIPVGQATKKAEDRHHHQFVPSETVSRTAGKEVEVRHCDISGHEHKDCWACNRGDGRGHDESCHADKVQVIRSVSVKKALRVIAPAGMVEGRKAWSSSTSGGRDRLLLSTAPAESMDGLRPKGGRGIGVSETESSDWAPSPRNPNASFSSELDGQGRTSPSRRRPTRRSKQKTKRVDPNSVQNHTSTVNEGNLGVASNYSYQLPQTHLSMIARARSKETLEALRSYRRMSECKPPLAVSS
ncbi:hypothetical protein MPTK2_3g11760 [Marchantia polymorpha subsp. ruderalis]